MNRTKRFALLWATAMALVIPAWSQSTNKTFTKGTLDIKYGSRVAKGQPDIYAMDLNVDNSAIFRGFITNTPIVFSTTLLGQTEVKRPAYLNYQLICAVVNPRNVEQKLDVGRLYGNVPISAIGLYDYNRGTLQIAVNQMGRAPAFASKYAGTAQGKPILKLSEGYFARAKKEALTLQRKAQGKTVSLVVSNYDKLVFNQHKMGAGPVMSYPEATVNGGMIYDGDRYAWYFQDISITYFMDGGQRADRLSGTIRWIEQPKKGNLRDGEYQFDVRLNEPPPDPTAVFSGAVNEDAFFAVDNTLAAWSGTMRYRDTLAGEKVVQSNVAIDLTGNQLNRQQTMNLVKLLLLDAIVPMNSE